MPIVINGTTFNNGGTAIFNGQTVKEIKFNTTTVWKAELVLFENGRFQNGVTNTFRYGNKHSIDGVYLKISNYENLQRETNTVNLRSIIDLSQYTRLVFVKYDGGYCKVGLTDYVGTYGSTTFVVGVDSAIGDNVLDISGLNPSGHYYLNFQMNNSTCRFSKIYLA